MASLLSLYLFFIANFKENQTDFVQRIKLYIYFHETSSILYNLTMVFDHNNKLVLWFFWRWRSFKDL